MGRSRVVPGAADAASPRAPIRLDPRSRGAESYIKLAKEIMDRQRPKELPAEVTEAMVSQSQS